MVPAVADLPLARVRDPEGARRLHGPRLDLLLDALVRADPVADALVAERGQGALAALEAALPPRPPWLTDDTLVRGGELVHRAGALAMIALASSSLVQGYASPGGNKTLVFTGRLEQQAFRRMHETARFVLAICTPHAMRPPHGSALRTVLQVRLVHARVRAMVRGSGAWDGARWGEPASQHDMLGTLLMFSVVLIEGLESLGLRVPDDEAERYVQLFRWVGVLLGIEPALLPCSYPDARELARLFRATQHAPDDDARALVRALYASPVREARDRIERAAGHVFRDLMIAGSRAMIPREVARDLDLPRARAMELALRLSRPIAHTWGELGRVPLARGATVRAGRAAWHHFVDRGLHGEPWDFPLPTALAGRAPRAA